MKKVLPILLALLFSLVACFPSNLPDVTPVSTPTSVVTEVPTVEPTTQPVETTKPESFCPDDLILIISQAKPLREIAGYNAKGFPVWGIYGKSIWVNRIIPNPGQEICVFPDIIKGDGADYAWKVYTAQRVGGQELPGTFYLYVLDRLVVLIVER